MAPASSIATKSSGFTGSGLTADITPQVRQNAVPLVSYGLFVGVAALLLIGFAAPLFRVSRVEVIGRNLPVTRVAAASSAQGRNIFTIRGSSILAHLRQLPNIMVTGVDVTLPGTVTIHASLRQPVIAWKQRRRLYLVDKHGHVISKVLTTSLPVINNYTGTPVHLGQDVNRIALLGATYTEATLPRAGIKAFALGVKRGLIIHSERGWNAVLGLPTGKRLVMRVATLKALLAKATASKRHLAFVDLRSSRSPYVSFR